MATSMFSLLRDTPKVNVSIPLADLFLDALVWIDINKSAFALLAMRARSFKLTKTSLLRV